MSAFVHVVDDDQSVRTSLYQLLTTRPELLVRSFRSGDDFLAALPELDRGVVLLDLNMPGVSGLDVLARLRDARPAFVTMMMTGYGDIATAVQAMRLGAFDFIEKPYDPHALLRSVDLCLAHLSKDSHSQEFSRSALAQIEKLTSREREVLLLLVEGKPNKAVARLLDVSPRTVEGHRASLMAKLGITSLPEAVRLTFAAGLFPAA